MHAITPEVRLHGTAMRLLYRFLSPRHPRGRLEMHAVVEGEELWVHTHGMSRWSLAELEMIGVPMDLRGEAHGLLYDLTGYCKLVKPIRPDEDFGGMLTGPEQGVPHVCTLRAVPERDEAHQRCLRVVDYHASLESGFPRKLFAVHLCGLAGQSRSDEARERRFRRATEIHPGEPVALGECRDPAGQIDLMETQQRANIRGWEGLGFALLDLGRDEEGLAAFQHVAGLAPEWARQYALHFLEGVEAGQAPKDHAVTRFWTEVSRHG